MTPYVLTYLSVGLAFFAWLLIYRMARRDLPRLMDKAHLTEAQGWATWIIWGAIFAVFWPIAIPLTLRSVWRS